MYARKVSLYLKSESVSQFLQKVEHEVIPLFRKQKGFLDQLILLADNGKMFYVYTFWENGDDAEKYDRTTLPALNQLLTAVVDGALRVHAFGGSRGRLSSPDQASNS
jgi:Antibiotic biosynthesis monooxygenase